MKLTLKKPAQQEWYDKEETQVIDRVSNPGFGKNSPTEQKERLSPKEVALVYFCQKIMAIGISQQELEQIFARPRKIDQKYLNQAQEIARRLLDKATERQFALLRKRKVLWACQEPEEK